ncbi:hypothetical protein [Methylobacterium sp. WL116]|uniref:hypothetical protein n=1 Tax=Methylobacterium sp. WL116 TaxID=2603889 RepID=UPI0011CA39A0|nr:hypothetical protein [Methylobacterium sp. WL116]TXM91989.1 hypothetical protein FV223_13330 [Methylobacterium sp. WL116]
MPPIHPDNCPVQKPYELFRAMLQLANDDCVATLRQYVGQLDVRRLENVCSEEIVRRRRARTEAEIKASAEKAAEIH